MAHIKVLSCLQVTQEPKVEVGSFNAPVRRKSGTPKNEIIFWGIAFYPIEPVAHIKVLSCLQVTREPKVEVGSFNTFSVSIL